MKLPFQKPKPSDTNQWKEMDSRLQDLHAYVKRMEASVEKIIKNPQIVIENIHIHQPVLEKMEYRLDKLDIEQLSGSLNLGNNFGSKPGTSPSALHSTAANQTKTVPPSPTGGKSADADIQSTSSGFRLRRDNI